ncbi:MAG: SusD/RagB family nutrient-binding outer membrane lipoprotein [Bacteroidales bacterium]|nr:SusD/RagB family nutrient-binding outer membrane lipoprotein [Bacteroidales bacterium]
MKSQIKYTGLYLLSIFLLLSCTKDFEEINTDPHGFTTASTGSIFNGIIQSIIPGGNELMYVNNEIIYKQTQQLALASSAWGNFTLGTESMWGSFYSTMANARELERRFDEDPSSDELTNMKAMIKIIMAYKTFRMTDIFGDMPYSEAAYGFSNLELLHPIYDSQESIYKYLLEELKWCDENINVDAVVEEPFATFKTFDALFNGDMLVWQKLANSMRLRYAMRMSEKEPVLAGEIIKEIIDNGRPIFLGYDFITYVGESACIWPNSMGFGNGAPNWAFREQKNLRVGSNIWSQVSLHDSTDGSGIFDPRAYIFFEGNNANEWVKYPQTPQANVPAHGGIPYGTHRDNAGAFDIKGETCIYTVVNYFMHRDANFMPIPMITGAEVHYILAEAYFRGIGLPQDPSLGEIEYMNGINASAEWWIGVSEGSILPLSGITFGEKVTIPSGLGSFSILNVFGMWNATTDEEKLKFIYTQRWLDAFWQPQEAYALARRTGLTPREGDPIGHFRLPYPPSEQEFNSENWFKAMDNQGGGDTPDFKIWWIP